MQPRQPTISFLFFLLVLFVIYRTEQISVAARFGAALMDNYSNSEKHYLVWAVTVRSRPPDSTTFMLQVLNASRVFYEICVHPTPLRLYLSH